MTAKARCRASARSWAVATLVAVTVVSLSGCGVYHKWRLGKKVTEVKQLLAEAQQAEAPKYSYEQYDNADNAAKNAEALINEGKYQEAQTRLEEARRLAIESKDTVPRNKAEILAKQEILNGLKGQMQEALQAALEAGADRTATNALDVAREAVNEWSGKHDALLKQPRQQPDQYDQLAQEGETVLQSAREAFNLARQPDARNFEEQINAIVARCEEIEAPAYMEVRWASATAELSVFRGLMDNERYAPAYDLGVELVPMLEQLERDGRRARASAYLERTATEIEAAKRGGAVTYAIEPLNAAVEAYNGADAAFAAGEFDECYRLCVEGRSQVESALGVIQERAGAAIDTVKVALERAREEEIDTFAPGVAADARRVLNEAQLSFVEGDYLKTLQQCEQTQELVDQAVVTAQRTKADRELARLDALVERARREGASEYTLAELNAVEREIAAIRERYDRQDYAEVLPLAELTRESADALMDALRVAADRRVREAEQAVARAVRAGGQVHAPALVTSARANLADASSAVARDELRRGFSLAAETEQTARQAANRAFQERTQTTLAQVQEELDLAAQAGAREHSPSLFVRAVDARDAARSLLREQSYEAALNQATESFLAAEGARLNKIRRAQSLADAALEAQAKDYAPVAIAAALEQLALAKDAMRRREFAASNQQADQAFQHAEEAYRSTWNQRSDVLLASVRQRLQAAKRNLAPDKAPELYATATSHLAEAEGRYAIGEFDEAYAAADRSSEALVELDASLGRTAREELDAIERAVVEIKSLGTDGVMRERFTPRHATIALAREAEKAGDYLTAFNLAQQLRAEVEADRGFAFGHHLGSRLSGVLALVGEYEQAGAAPLAPERFAEFHRRIDEISAAQVSEASYEAAVIQIDQLREAVIEVETEIRTSIEERIAQMEAQLDQARREEAETYYPTEFNQALEAFTAMRNLPRGRNYGEIYTTLTAAENAVTGVLNQAVVGRQERAYKLEVQDRVKEMNDLLNQFEPVTMIPRQAWRASLRGPEKTSHEQHINPYRSGQTVISDENFLVLSTDLRRRVREVKPPPTLVQLHNEVLATFDQLVMTADYFNRVGNVEAYNREMRLVFLDRAYDSLELLNQMNAGIQGGLMIQDPLEYKIEAELTWGEKLERWFWAW